MTKDNGVNYISLDYEDFACLVKGGVLHIDNHTKIILKDIGYSGMDCAITEAIHGLNIGEDHQKK